MCFCGRFGEQPSDLLELGWNYNILSPKKFCYGEKTMGEKPQFCSKIMKRPSSDDHVDKNLLLMMWMKLAEIQLGLPSTPSELTE